MTTFVNIMETTSTTLFSIGVLLIIGTFIVGAIHSKVDTKNSKRALNITTMGVLVFIGLGGVTGTLYLLLQTFITL